MASTMVEAMLLHTVVVMEEGMVEVVMEGTGEGEVVMEDMVAMEEDMMDTVATAGRAEAEVSQRHGSIQLGEDDDSVTELV